MRSPEPAPATDRFSTRFMALLRLELRELRSSRASWLLLALVGPLVGQAFATAVATYAEASGGGGPSPTAAALASALSPLDGIVVPTLGAYALVLTFLVPFVAIRLIVAERESGAALLAAQLPAGAWLRLAAKLAALAGGWTLAWIPGLLALALWRGAGGHLDAAETANVVLGHQLVAAATIAVALAAAAVARSSAAAAILVLALSIGSWAVEFLAAVHGGAWARAALATPGTALRVFEHGELRPGLVAALAGATVGALAVAALALDPFRSAARRRTLGLAVVAVAAAAIVAGASSPRGLDLSEDRRNSFPPADEAILRRLPATLAVEVHLAPEDPRLSDLRRHVLDRLARVVPRLAVREIGSGSGLFASDPRYGEMEWSLGGRSVVLRSTIERVVLDAVEGLAGATPASHAAAEPSYPGHPLAASIPAAAPLFFVVLPALAAAGFLVLTVRLRRSP